MIVDVADNFVSYLEFDLRALHLSPDMGDYIKPSVRPLSSRSLAFSLPPGVQASEVQRAIESEGPDWLETVDITDLFTHEEEGTSYRAVTFAIRYRNDKSEHSTEDLNTTTEHLATAVLSKLSARGVQQRA